VNSRNPQYLAGQRLVHLWRILFRPLGIGRIFHRRD
jgi:hypothetical protein